MDGRDEAREPSRPPAAEQQAVVSVVVPAYNEAGVITRLLDALAGEDGGDGLDVVVVCNGCTDDTESVARQHPLGATVISTPVGSKNLALGLGDAAARGFPRFYVDADVVVTGAGLRRMATRLHGGCHAVAPERELRLDRSAPIVRAYYRIWEQLPSVRRGLFGRGVIGVDQPGFDRVTPRPELMGDDLALDLAFGAPERYVDPTVAARIEAPRTLADLLRRRVRAHQGNRQVDRSDRLGDAPRRGAGLRDVVSVVRDRVASPVDALGFVAVTVAGRVLAARRRDDAPWLRDESSRAA